MCVCIYIYQLLLPNDDENIKSRFTVIDDDDVRIQIIQLYLFDDGSRRRQACLCV